MGRPTNVEIQIVGRDLKPEELLALDPDQFLGACVICRFRKPGAPTLYGIVYENKNPKDKPRYLGFGFVFGMREPEETIIETGIRETEEELLGFRPELTEKNLLGLMWITPDTELMPRCHAIFLLDLPYDLPVRPGSENEDEQLGAFKLPLDGEDGIDDLMARNLFFPNHVVTREEILPHAPVE